MSSNTDDSSQKSFTDKDSDFKSISTEEYKVFIENTPTKYPLPLEVPNTVHGIYDFRIENAENLKNLQE